MIQCRRQHLIGMRPCHFLSHLTWTSTPLVITQRLRTTSSKVTLSLRTFVHLLSRRLTLTQFFFEDVTTAANIDKRQVKVTRLRAGSVIVDMLITKEAGDTHKIVQGLQEQLRHPNSLLRMGKLTSRASSSPRNSNDDKSCSDEADDDTAILKEQRGVPHYSKHAAPGLQSCVLSVQRARTHTM